MKVPMLDPVLGNCAFQTELEQAATRVLRSGCFILGPEVEKFEYEVAQYLGVKYAVGVSSGTDALLAALMALDIGPGDEVICPAFTFFATAGSIARVGATPVFVDVLRASFNMDPAQLERAITPRTRAIIPVHLFGQCADMTWINRIAREYSLPIIEDACQAIGAETIAGEKAGNLGTMGCFSFFPSKNLGGFGDGGLVTTNDEALRDKIVRLRNHGARDRYVHEQIGGNFRLDALQAALLCVKLKYLPEMLSSRKLNARRYGEELGGLKQIQLPSDLTFGGASWNQYTIKVYSSKDRMLLAAYLEKRGVGFGTYYPVPLHKQSCFRTTCALPATDDLAPRVLSLPVAAEVLYEQTGYVCETIKEFFNATT